MRRTRAVRRSAALAVVPSLVLLGPPLAHASTPAATEAAPAVVVPAQAATPPAPTPAPPTPAPAPPTPAPAPAPAAATLRLAVEHADGGVALKGDRWRALVVSSTYVAGTKVRVSFTVGRKRVTRTVTIKPAKAAGKGSVRVTVPAQARSGRRVVVRARIAKQQPTAPVAARTTVVRQATPDVDPGERGLAVEILQGMLAKQAYVIGTKGVFDARTQRAVLAFRKVAGMAATSRADSAVFAALRAGKGTFEVRFPNHGRHVEGDLEHRVLVLIDKGRPVRIYHTSPGTPATPTIRGSFAVYMKDPGTNAKGMYKSSYFIRGYAVHGYPSVPAGYSASHGCLRVPMADADAIYAWMTIGMRVDTY